MIYDVFISYRRIDSKGDSNVADARTIKMALESRGFKVFFDYSECTHGIFEDRILPAIRTCRFFVLVLTSGALDRCKNNGDWLRREIEEALKYNRVIIPITLDTKPFGNFPTDLPQSMASLPKNQVITIHMDRSFDSCIDIFIKDCQMIPHLKHEHNQDSTEFNPSIPLPYLKLKSDINCVFYLDGEKITRLEAGVIKKIHLAQGEYELRFVNVENPADVKEMVFEMPECDKLLKVDMNDKRDNLQEKEFKTTFSEEENEQKDWKCRKEGKGEKRDQEFNLNGVSFKMIYVRGGTFMMGATPEQGKDVEDNENPVHQVTLSDYFIGETQVTQSLWKAVMGTNPSYFKGDDLPVEEVSWNDCQNFIQKLNALTGKTFHLPTEAEWEYAARGGDKCQNFKYAGGNTIGDVAWYKDNCDDKAHSVKGKRPNELGLYDMSGNVWEWCEDRYENYNVSNQSDPKGPLFGLDHLLRGGSRNDRARNCRVSKRFLRPGGHPDRYIGMRLALEKEQEDETKTFNVGEVEFKMIRVSGGTFMMGAQGKDSNADNYDTEAYDDESPVHDVTLSDFFIAETEVTQALWKEVMGTEPLFDGGWKEKLGRGDSYPVYWVSWNDCQDFIRKLNAKTGQSFRLPTEAEWEFAARGGNKSRGFKYAGSNMLGDVAWYSDNSDSKTHPVKGKQPNELKLYDMSGNVWEWCQDIYPMGDYSISQSDISTCKAEGLNRVLRGGSWDDYPRGCRVAVRGNGVDGCPYLNHGLRLAM